MIYLFRFQFLLIVTLLLLATSCRQGQSPRPRAYFRISLPEKEYRMLDSVYPYSFMLPVYSRLEPDTHDMAEPFWANIRFPDFKATIHLSYKPIRTSEDLWQYFDDARVFAQRHIPKATAIREEVIMHDHRRVSGLYIRIMGREAASPVQFYVTDSVAHFLRGALYFEVTPNNDSLAPVISFIEEDIRYMLETMNWKAPGHVSDEHAIH